jgi:hypothetical protein
MILMCQLFEIFFAYFYRLIFLKPLFDFKNKLN